MSIAKIRCDKCHKQIDIDDTNYLTVRDTILCDRNLVSARICSSCTHKLRDFLYQDDNN